jgi:hypothetical protein
MRTPAGCCFVVAVLGGCQQGGDKPTEAQAQVPASVGDAYRRDVERICNVLALSGADQRPAEEWLWTTSSWLGDNVVTDDGRAFMIAFKQAPAPAQALRAEAGRVGLDGCPLADWWAK